METVEVNEEYVNTIKKHQEYITMTEDCYARMVALNQVCDLSTNTMYEFAKKEFATGKDRIQQFVRATTGTPLYTNIQTYLKTLQRVNIEYELRNESEYEDHFQKHAMYCYLFPRTTYQTSLSLFSLVVYDEIDALGIEEKVDTLIAIFDNFPDLCL